MDAPDQRSIDARRQFGVINLDKPAGPTSHQVVSWVKTLLDVDRAAHAGTLDPKVTGCLPVLLGDATRLAQSLLVGEKRYVVVLEGHERFPERFDTVIAEFEGELYQRPPRKSAVARRMRTRRVTELSVLERAERRALLSVRCESGTYIRKLCHDIGLALGTGAHMGDLRRVKTPPFDDRTLITLHELSEAVVGEAAGESDDLDRILLPGEQALTHLPEVTIAPSTAESVLQGSPIYAPGVIEAPEDLTTDDLVVCVTPSGWAVCLGTIVGDPHADAGDVVALERVLRSTSDSKDINPEPGE